MNSGSSSISSDHRQSNKNSSISSSSSVSNVVSTMINRSASGKSCNSIASLGIGSGVSNLSPNEQQQRNLLKKKLDIELVKPKPENSQHMSHDHGSPMYDCILFLIYCIEHDRFAVTNVNDDHQTIWLPFVSRDGNDWSRASELGLLSMFEKRDPDGVVTNHVNISHTTKMIELCHIQTVSGRWIQRATQFITITRCQKTCQPINSIQWMNAGNILKDDSAIWGPEFRKYLEHLERHYSELQVVEYPIDSVLRYHLTHSNERSDKQSVTAISGLMKARNLSLKLLTDLYEHYIRHTFPSYYMNFGSFKIYLQKCGLKSDIISAQAKYMFNCCLIRTNRDCNGATYVDFHDICYLLLVLDPEIPDDNKYRQAFVINFIDQQNMSDSSEDGENNKSSHNVMPQKSKHSSLNKVHSMVLSAMNRQPNKQPITKTAKSNNVGDMNESIIGPTKLTKSVFAKLTKMKKKQTERLVSDKANLTRGLCRNCRVKSFEYGQHCIMFDSMGRCVEPKIILNAENQFIPISKLEGNKLYSAEHVFKPDSIGNILFDYMRNRKFLANTLSTTGIQHHPTAIMPDDDNTTERLGGAGSMDDVEFLDINAIQAICDCTRKLLKYEPKLIKRSGSTVIIGDIRGDFDTLLTMEQSLWPTVPVIAQNLVFLGNYTGNSKKTIHDYNIETIIYLFAVKYLCPNKVILLKGINETRAYNEKTLLVECRNRYGDERGGRIWRTINQVFDELPFVCIINESIVCASSGIPKDSLRHKLSTYFDSYVMDTKSSTVCGNFANNKEFALFQHILVNIPEHTQPPQNHSPSESKSTHLFKENPALPNGFIFSREAFLQFMSLNNFSYMIRSNEEPPYTAYMMNGYHLLNDNRLISIISNIYIDESGQQKRNKAIVAYVHHPDGRIQLKQLENEYQKQSTAKQRMSPNVFFNKNQ